jgi:hypothetical protein
VLREFMSSPGALEAIRRIDGARRQPEFADACPLMEPCQLIAWHRAHDVALLHVIDLALGGDPLEATMVLHDLVRMDKAELGSARSLLSMLIALANLEDAVTITNMIGPTLYEHPASDEVAAAAAKLAAEIRSIDVDTVDLRAVVIADYLFEVRAVDAIASDSDRPIDVAAPRWLLNRGLTLRSIDANSAHRYDAAVEGDLHAALGGDETSPKQRFGWWLQNPGGDLLIDAMTHDPQPYVSSIEEHLANIASQRSQLSARVPSF